MYIYERHNGIVGTHGTLPLLPRNSSIVGQKKGSRGRRRACTAATAAAAATEGHEAKERKRIERESAVGRLWPRGTKKKKKGPTSATA